MMDYSKQFVLTIESYSWKTYPFMDNRVIHFSIVEPIQKPDIRVAHVLNVFCRKHTFEKSVFGVHIYICIGHKEMSIGYKEMCIGHA